MSKHKNIFVVDDDEMMTTLLSDHLSKNPFYKVSVFNTGEDCINNLRFDPDVIILDYQLNAVVHEAADGLKILQEIRKIDKQVCVIMLSSQEDYGRALQTIMKGALEYVVKAEDAFKRIDHILDNIYLQ